MNRQQVASFPPPRFPDRNKGKIGVCAQCGEAYPTSQGDCCLACQRKGYYKLK